MWTLLSALFGDRVLGGGQKQLFTRDTDFQLVAVPVGRLIFLFGNLVTEFGNPKPLRAVSTALNFELVFHHPTVNLGPVTPQQRLAAGNVIDRVLTLSESRIEELDIKSSALLVGQQWENG